jgi:5-hydroxyisourate hydrolase-like protein (transthyretin family)
VNRLLLVVLVGAALTVFAGRTSAAAPTRLTLTVPPSVGLGEEITVEARLVSADGKPAAGASLTLYQVGAVGQRAMAKATTDEKGAAAFRHAEYTVADLTFRVDFVGSAEYGASHADADVHVTGIDVPPSVGMAHTPSLLVKGVLVSVLGGVWLTYLYAASHVLRLMREKPDAREHHSTH